MYRYQPDTQRDLPVINAIQDVLADNPGFGFGKIFKTLKPAGLSMESQACLSGVLPTQANQAAAGLYERRFDGWPSLPDV